MVNRSTDGYATFYVDFERIRKHDEYVYFWDLTDYLRPEYGDLSTSVYNQGDCNLFRVKVLSNVFHQQPMGRDVGRTYSPENPEWIYPRPESIQESLLQTVCSVTP